MLIRSTFPGSKDNVVPGQPAPRGRASWPRRRFRPDPPARRGERAHSLSHTREQFTLSREGGITSAVLYGAEEDNLNAQRHRGETI